MKTVIFDIEASCEDRNLDKNRTYNMETIEIGAVKIENGQITEHFKTFIRPEYVDKLTPFCTDLTGITFKDLENSPLFNEAILDFYEFIQGCTIYSCGDFDKKFLVRELKEKGNSLTHKLVENAILSSHKNLKVLFSDITQKGQKGMLGMASVLNVNIEGTHHRAYDDAKNLADIYLKLQDVRKQELEKVFNDKVFSKLIEKLRELHNNNILQEQNNISKVELLDNLRYVILIDHKENGRSYLTKEQLETLKRYTLK